MEEFNVYCRNEKTKIPYVHCLSHQLHLVVVHAMSVEQPINDFLHVCGSLSNFFRKPTIARHYNGEKLKRLLEQRWTGHLAAETAVLYSFQNITSLLLEMSSSRAHKVETCIEVSELLREVQKQSYLFIGKMLYKVCIAVQSFL